MLEGVLDVAERAGGDGLRLPAGEERAAMHSRQQPRTGPAPTTSVRRRDNYQHRPDRCRSSKLLLNERV